MEVFSRVFNLSFSRFFESVPKLLITFLLHSFQVLALPVFPPSLPVELPVVLAMWTLQLHSNSSAFFVFDWFLADFLSVLGVLLHMFDNEVEVQKKSEIIFRSLDT